MSLCSGGCPQTWRAGSGHQMNECITSAMAPMNNGGWLPSAYYNVGAPAFNYNGNVIHGIAFGLGNMNCYNGTLRTELFVHSWSAWVAPTVPVPTTPAQAGSYASQACIKLQGSGAYSNMGGDIRSMYDWHIYLGLGSAAVLVVTT